MANVDTFNEGWDLGSKQKGTGEKHKNTPKPVGQVTTSDGQTLYPSAPLKYYKKGGKVKKTGPAYIHKGERVLTAKQDKKYSKKKSTRKRVASKG
jgi:hypothetical protein